MSMIMVVGLVLLNLVISFWNARNVGQIWAESKVLGGFSRLLAWCGAIQSAIGFTYSYAIIISMAGAMFGVIPDAVVKFILSFTYLLIILPAIGTGIIITITSWINFAREKSLLNLGLAGWNTFAEIYNIYHAVNSFGAAVDTVKEGFGILNSDTDFDSDSDSGKMMLGIFIVAFAVIGGILTTMMIMRRYEATLPMPERNIALER